MLIVDEMCSTYIILYQLLTGSAGSVFISYNHGSRSRVFKVRDRLRAAGFVVWIDEDEMCTYIIIIIIIFSIIICYA